MKRIRGSATVTVLLAILVTAIAAPPTFAGTRKMALGISSLDNQSVAALEANAAAVGRMPAIWGVWSTWGAPDRDFPTGFMNELKARHIVPMVNWQPVGSNPNDCANWDLDAIIRGDFDGYVRQWANAAKNFGDTILLRFAHEMNGNWFIWGYTMCDNTPAKFKTAWIHVWNIFRGPGGENATNVKFVWSPYGANALKSHYPGNAYVDYAGFTGFNWGPNGGPAARPWASMVANFKGTVRGLQRVARGKPLIGAEVGAAYLPNCASCDKAAWIRTGYPAVFAKWPRIVAIVYFDIDLTVIANQPNWRLDSPAAALQAYRSIASDSRFQGSLAR